MALLLYLLMLFHLADHILFQAEKLLSQGMQAFAIEPAYYAALKAFASECRGRGKFGYAMIHIPPQLTDHLFVRGNLSRQTVDGIYSYMVYKEKLKFLIQSAGEHIICQHIHYCNDIKILFGIIVVHCGLLPTSIDIQRFINEHCPA